VTKVDLIYFNAGGGHRAAALALESSIKQSKCWDVRLVNLFDIILPEINNPESYYNLRIGKGFTLGLRHELKLLQAFVRASMKFLIKRLEAHWAETKPDLIVSLVPNFNRVMFNACGNTPYVTILTDLADYPPNFWIEDQPQHIICGTDAAMEQVKAYAPSAKSYQVSGMIVRPEFYAEKHRVKLSWFDSQKPVGIVMFGGAGSTAMLQINKLLDSTQLIFMCGHNEKLQTKLQETKSSAPRGYIGFTNDVISYMHSADFFIGKPGPGSISEALLAGLPIITVKNAFTLPQERYNCDWITEKGVGVVVNSIKNLPEAVDLVLDQRASFISRIGNINNQAVFEIPDILQSILA